MYNCLFFELFSSVIPLLYKIRCTTIFHTIFNNKKILNFYWALSPECLRSCGRAGRSLSVPTRVLLPSLHPGQMSCPITPADLAPHTPGLHWLSIQPSTSSPHTHNHPFYYHQPLIYQPRNLSSYTPVCPLLAGRFEIQLFAASTFCSRIRRCQFCTHVCCIYSLLISVVVIRTRPCCNIR